MSDHVRPHHYHHYHVRPGNGHVGVWLHDFPYARVTANCCCVVVIATHRVQLPGGAVQHNYTGCQDQQDQSGKEHHGQISSTACSDKRGGEH